MSLIYSTDIVTLADVTITNYSTTEAVGHEANNVLVLDNLGRDWRCADTDVDSGMYFDFGSDGADLAAIALLDANFSKVQIIGSDDAVNWDDSADYDSGIVTISRNPYTGRYNVYINTAAMSTREYVRVTVPTGASAVGRYTNTWKIGSVVMCYSVTELSTGRDSMAPGATQARLNPALSNGRLRPIKQGSLWRFEDIISFPTGAEADREEVLDLFTADDLNPGLLLYYNNGDTSEVYFGLKSPEFRSEYVMSGVCKPSSFKFMEYV